MEYRVMNIQETTAEQLRAWFHQADPARQEQLLRFRRREDQLRSLCADHLAREMLSEKLNCSPSDLIFSRTEQGKPYLNDSSLQFNLSHSGDFAACAVSEFPVGIDIEVLRPVRPELSKKVCAKEEHVYIHPHGQFDSVRFLRLWTAKEAFLKQRGEGILTDLRRLNLVRNGEIVCPDRIISYSTLTDQYVLSVAYEAPQQQSTSLQLD